KSESAPDAVKRSCFDFSIFRFFSCWRMQMKSTIRPPIYGLLAEFREPEELLEAVRRAYDAGYRRMDAYTPFPVEGLAEALHTGPSRLPFIVLIGGLIGAAGGYFMQYYASVIS